MEVLGLLRSKRQCLVAFLEATRAFAAQAQAGDFSGLDAFERERESALRALGLFDRKLTESVADFPAERRTAEFLAEVNASIEEQGRLLEEAFSLDARIMRDIESEQLRLVRELAAAGRSKEIVNRFKSGSAPSADATGLDRHV